METGFADLFGMIIGFVLTLMVLSYIIGDNFLFRLAMAIFVGVASGYAAVMVIYNVLWYQLIVPLLTSPTQNLQITIPTILLGLALVTKGFNRNSRVGNSVLAYLVGVGAATAIGGAIFGTILPQAAASANLLNLAYATPGGIGLVGWLLKGLVILFGTLATLAYFHFGVRSEGEGSLPVRHPVIENVLAPAGKAFIAVTLGVIFAGVFSASLSALIDRMLFVWEFLQGIL